MRHVLSVLLLTAGAADAFAFAPAHHQRRPSLPTTRRSSSAVLVAPSTVGWTVGCILGGTVGTPAVIKATQTWYRRIPLPSWTPPDRVFAPVWTTLYAMMGIAAARVSATLGVRSAPILHFFAHFVVNLAWAPVFFGLQKLRFALYMNFALILSLAVLIAQYAAVSGPAGLLLVPYMAWLLFATKLNAAICDLNPMSNGYSNARLQADTARLQKQAYNRVFA